MDLPQHHGGRITTFRLGTLAAALGVICALFVVYRDQLSMRSTLGLLALATAFTRHGAAAIDLGYYPPNATNINNLPHVLNTTGVYGFIFNNSYPTDVPYGTYDWCNMPHVRKQEYIVPSSEHTLRYVELVHRHHKRTVYAANSFPVESYEWNCNDEGLYYYGQPGPLSGNRSAHTYWMQSVPGSGINPFIPTGFLGSCQFPQITKGGLDDSWQHGKDLYGVYHDLIHLIPDNSTGKVAFRVTQNTITSQVTGMVINGMFGTQADVPLRIEASGIDSLEPTYTCTTSAYIYGNETSSTAWKNHLNESAPLYAVLDNISGISPNETNLGFHVSFDHYYDNLSARLCHAKPLPCKLVNGTNSTNCVTQAIADEVFRLGQWEYSYQYRDSNTSLNAAVGSYGVWMAQLARHIRDRISGASDIVYFHNVAHDGSISRLLSFLQVDVMVWPGMGSEVVFEVYEKTGTIASSECSYYVRVLWGGKVLRSSSPTLGLLDMVPLNTLLAYIDGLVGVDASLIKGKCNGTIPY